MPVKSRSARQGGERGLARKLLDQIALMRADPERFGRNIMQFTHRPLFETRLIDVMDSVPMHVTIDPGLACRPALNVLSSALSETGMTGGPNTLLNLALRIARHGVTVRLVTTVTTSKIKPDWFARHAAELIGDDALPDVPIVTAADAARPLAVGPADIFMASHWTTAQQLKAVLPRMKCRQFLYMLQEFEPGFYAWSSNHALALETYGMDFWPVVNESLLAEYLFGQAFGRLADPETRRRATVFEPATEARLFRPAVETGAARRKRLLFYARPTNARNMFGLGLAALRAASADPVFAGWEFLSIGGRGSVPELALGGGHRLIPAPWMDYAAYAGSLQQADLLLCPMLSPHTSYPVLEMAACGGVAVTNTFANKTAARMAALSPDILAMDATVEGLAEGLRAGARKVAEREAGRVQRVSSLSGARDWAETLDPAAARLAEIFRTLSSGT
jgi:hypothetical protein